MSEVPLIQFSSESLLQESHQQVQKGMEEWEQLERELENMKELVTKFRLKRGNFAGEVKVESSTWKDKVQQLLEQMSLLKEEKEQGMRRVSQLETNLVELRRQLAELLPLQLPAGPSQAELQLQAEAYRLQKQLQNMEEQLYIQMQENQSLSLQNLEQQERLWFLDQQAGVWNEHTQDQHQLHKTTDRDETMRSTILHNQELKDQLAQLQDAFHRLSGEKEELASILHSEHQVKKHLQEKLDQLEKKSDEWKEMAELKSQAAQNLQEQHDQYLAQLQELSATCDQYMATNQQLTSEKDDLQQHLLRQTQLLEQLEQEQAQTKLEDQIANQKLQDTLKCLEATRHHNEQLRAQLSFLAFPREGEGVSKEEKNEEVTPSDVTVPEDVDNPQTMWEFYLEALSVAESKKVKLGQQLQEQQARCGCLANLAAQFQTKLEPPALFPKNWNHGVSVERKQNTHTPKKKLRICFTHDLPDKVNYQKQSDDLQHQCSQLSEHMATIEESIVFYKEQMAVLDELYQEKDNCVCWLAQEKREKKKELQELLLHLAGEGTECQYQIWAATQSPPAEASPDHLGTTNMEVLEEWQALEEVKFEDNQGKARVPWPLENPTTEQLMLPQPGIKHLQGLHGLDANDEMEIITA